MKALIAALLSAVSLVAQNPRTAVYPDAIATDQDLGVACNAAKSTLASGIDASTLSITLTSAASFCYPSYVTINNAEVVKVCSIAGAVLTVCSGGRGVHGGAASHAAGEPVNIYVDSNYLNQLAAEIKAIQTAMGVNFENIALPATTDVLMGDGEGGAAASGITKSGDDFTFPGAINMGDPKLSYGGTCTNDSAVSAPTGSGSPITCWNSCDDNVKKCKDGSGNITMHALSKTCDSGQTMTAYSQSTGQFTCTTVGSVAQTVVLPLAHRIIGGTTYNSPHVVMASGAFANILDLGSGYYLPVMQFPNSSSQSITVRTVVPKWWSSGTVTLTLVGTQAYGGEATNKYNVQTGCIAADGTITPTYNTAQSSTFNVTNAKQSYGTISSLTMTGCSGGLVMWMQITRDETVSGNLAEAVHLSEIILGY